MAALLYCRVVSLAETVGHIQCGFFILCYVLVHVKSFLKTSSAPKTKKSFFPEINEEIITESAKVGKKHDDDDDDAPNHRHGG